MRGDVPSWRPAAQQDADRREMERMGDFESERPSRESDYYWNNTDFSRRLRFNRRQMTAPAKSKVGDSVEGVTVDSLRNAIERRIESGLKEKEYRFKNPGDRKRLVSEAVKFYKRFSQKTVMLSDGRCVYFVPDARAKGERGLSNDEAWAEYAIHAVTSSGQKLDGKDYNERLFNKTKAANIWRIENILKAERCEAQDATEGRDAGIAFYGRGVDGKTIKIITRLDEADNIYADLSEVTVVNDRKTKELPPRKPPAEVVGTVRKGGDLLAADNKSIPQTGVSAQGENLRMSRSGIFTGTAADYANRSRQGGVDDGPSVKKIGTANGVAFGCGLYGSSAKSDAEGFGRNVVEQTFFTNRAPGDESHLIDWGKPLSEENRKRILDGLVHRARYSENLKKAIEHNLAEEARDFGLDQNEDYVPEEVEGMADDVLREAIERTIDVQTDRGESVYKHLAALLTGKTLGEVNNFKNRTEVYKAASEFLRDECDIDGIKYPAEADGAKAGWNYVAFSDEHIRVDHKWTDGQMRYSHSMRPSAPGDGKQRYYEAKFLHAAGNVVRIL